MFYNRVMEWAVSRGWVIFRVSEGYWETAPSIGMECRAVLGGQYGSNIQSSPATKRGMR